MLLAHRGNILARLGVDLCAIIRWEEIADIYRWEESLALGIRGTKTRESGYSSSHGFGRRMCRDLSCRQLMILRMEARIVVWRSGGVQPKRTLRSEVMVVAMA